MELDEIEVLLERYFEAETTIDDEQRLREYFLSDDVAPHLQQYQILFGFYANAQKEQMPEKQKATNAIAARWLSIAAAVVVLIGVGTYTVLNQNEDLGTYDDPEIAFIETQKALQMLSDNVNKGVNSVEYVVEYEESKERIFKN